MPEHHRTATRTGRRRFLGALLGLGLYGLLSARVLAALEESGANARLMASMRRLYGEAGVERLRQWFALEARLADGPVERQLKEINDFFNRSALWRDDFETNGVGDHWATPLETLGEGRADCEDYTIAKYIALRRLGIGDARLRLIYVRARIGRAGEPIAHMVLGYFTAPNTEPLILDNIIAAIRPASERSDLTPVFSFNSEGLWAGSSPRSRADPLARLSRWRDVIERMRQQGFE